MLCFIFLPKNKKMTDSSTKGTGQPLAATKEMITRKGAKVTKRKRDEALTAENA